MLAGSLGAGELRFDFFPVLRDRARKLAAGEFAAPKEDVPEWLRHLTYDQLRRIEFDGRHSLWHREGLSFEAQFLHPGFLFDRTVRLFELQGSRVEALAFRREYFNYQGVAAGELPAAMGFAGFRLMFPFGGRGQPPNEIGSFAGASYFRFLCAQAAYGLSARGLALNTAEPEAEEFPRFSEFWLERPARDDRRLVVFALLESASAAGAYRFALAPGTTTVVDVNAAVFFRQRPRVIGVAPLTSMFWRGENSNAGADDFRPEVHDSDGLLLHTGAGEWIWRPLVNPRQLRVATFADEHPRGFGLLQRDRSFESYQDLEAAYHTRPSAWVEPVGDWGRGGVRLVEIPTNRELDDNVVVFWVPEKSPRAGEALELAYRLHWFLDPLGPPAGFVRATRRGKSAVYEPGLERFVVDFDGPRLQVLGAGAGLEPVVTVGPGARLNHASLQKIPSNGAWRVAFTIKPEAAGRPVELRCFIREAGAALTETWSYLWQP
jgi:glucans biosynthesis protein